MKKSLIAFAVLSAFAGAAAAQTNVTVYGVADIGLTYNKAGANTARWGLDSGNQSGSRIGFRGTEDLGGGLSAIFALENGFNLDDGSFGGNALFNRQAYVGLKGNFGTVKLGHQYTPIFVALDTIDPFNTGLSGNILTAFAGGYNGGINGDIRMSNAINYSIASGAFSGEVAYGLGEQAGSFGDQAQFGLSAGYANGPITAVLAHHRADDTANASDFRTTMIGATYNFGVATVHGAFATDDLETAGVEVVDARNYMLGVSAGVGAAGKVMASFVRNDQRLAGGVDADQYAIGYTHNLSKRTNLYTSVGRVNIKAAGAADATNFTAGVRHLF